MNVLRRKECERIEEQMAWFKVHGKNAFMSVSRIMKKNEVQDRKTER